MNEMEQLIDDYFSDCEHMANLMVAWCEPSREVLAKIAKYQRKVKLWKQYKKGKYLNEKSLKKDY